jgi:cystathionine beta-lyase
MIAAMGTFCSKGDNVLVHSPTYMGFTGSLQNSGYHIVHSPLVLDGQGIWRMDFEDMERKIRENQIHAAIFCSPHNPTGRVWERWEIERAMEIYQKYEVYVVSDEIWSDIILGNNQHIPTQSVSADAAQRTVAMYAPSKTFNLAGLIGSYHIIYNPRLRDRVNKEASLSHYNSMNVLSMHALIGAYRPEGEEWVEQLRQTLTENMEFAYEFIQNRFPGVRVSKPQGTYMMFLDCREWLQAHRMTLDELIVKGHDVGVAWQDGRHHGGVTHIRMNLALPLSRVKEAFSRLERYVFSEKE